MDKIQGDELASTGILSTMSRPIPAREPLMSVADQFQQLEAHASRLIIGQSHLINRMLITLLCDGHLLVEHVLGAVGVERGPMRLGGLHQLVERLQLVAGSTGISSCMVVPSPMPLSRPGSMPRPSRPIHKFSRP